MRILYVNHTGQVGGAEHSLRHLASAMQATHDVAIAVPAGAALDLYRAAGLQVYEIPTAGGSGARAKALAWLGAARAVAGIRREFRPDIVHANSPRAGLLVTLGRRPVPVVVHVRDLLFGVAMRRAVMPWVIGRADESVAVSEAVDQRIREMTRRGAEVIYNPVPPGFAAPDEAQRARARSERGLGDELVITQVAQLTPWKQQDATIRAVGRLHAAGFPVRLFLLGGTVDTDPATAAVNADYRALLGGLITEYGLGEVASLEGSVSDVRGWLWASDITVLPSLEEPFGRAVVESMACGVATVATDRGGPREIIEDGMTGRLIDPTNANDLHDALLGLCRLAGLRGRIAAAGATRAADFSLERHAAQVEELYAAVVARERAGAGTRASATARRRGRR